MDASAPKQEGNERDACGCLNYYVQLFILCCLEIGACICLYLGQQAEFGTLDQEPGGSLSWVR